jgi:hypothetical protein
MHSGGIAAGAAGGVSMDEFRDAIAAFNGAVRRTLATCQSLTPEVWNAHLRAGFSIGEILEHMALSNGLFERRLASIIGKPAGDSVYACLEDEEIPHLFERAIEPPGIAEPTGEWRDSKEALARFSASARPISALATEDPGDLRRKGAPHPVFGPLDGVQWVLFTTAHNERHRSEIIGLAALAQSAYGTERPPK